jgi:hypothetical protein
MTAGQRQSPAVLSGRVQVLDFRSCDQRSRRDPSDSSIPYTAAIHYNTAHHHTMASSDSKIQYVQSHGIFCAIANITNNHLTGNSWESPEASSRTSHVALITHTRQSSLTHTSSQRIRALAPPNRRAQPHPSPHLHPQQPQTARARQGL